MKKGLYYLAYTCLIFLAGFSSYAQTGKTGINKVPETTLDVHGDIRGDSSLSIGPTNDTDGDSTIFINNGRLGIGTTNPAGQFQVGINNTVTGSTADQTGSGTAISSSDNNPNYEKTKAFDNANNGLGWANTNTPSPHWLGYDFGVAKVITTYTFYAGNNNELPRDWQFQGSNDAANWTTLDTQTNGYVANSSSFANPASFDVNNTTPYRYYRLFITAKTGSSNIIRIDEMQLIAGDYTASKEGLKVDDGTVTISGAYTLPTADGSSSGQVMTTDGSGNLSWTAPTANTDNQNLTLSGNSLSISGGTGVTLPRAVGWSDNEGAAPGEFSSTQMSYAFGHFNNISGAYADLLVMRGWYDGSGGSDNMLSIRRSGGIGMRIYQQNSGSSTNFSNYKEAVLAEPNGNVSLNGITALNRNELRLRSSTDNLHALRMAGGGSGSSNFAGIDVDGPALYGWHGGVLGSTFNGVERAVLRWRSNGNVGIGTANPTERLHIKKDGGLVSMLESDAGSSIWTYHNYGSTLKAAAGWRGGSSNYYSIYVNGSDRFVIKENGNIGIGTTNPNSALHVVGNRDNTPDAAGVHIGQGGTNDYAIDIAAGGTSNSSYIDFTTPGVDFRGRLIYSHGSNSMSFYTNGTQRMVIDGSGQTLLYGRAALNSNELRLRSITDANHGLKWTNNFAGISVDGPALYGYAGGVLGTTNGGEKAALSWKSNGNVGIGTDNPTGQFQVGETVTVTGSGNDDQTVPSGPGVAATSSSAVNSNTFANRAFDNNGNTYWMSASAPPQWLRYDFGANNAKIITTYRMVAHPVNNGVSRPRSWIFQGSNNNSNWTNIQSITNGTVSTNGLSTFRTGNTTAYRYYRIYVSANHGGSRVALREVQLIAGNYRTSKAALTVDNGRVFVSGSYRLPTENTPITGWVLKGNASNGNAYWASDAVSSDVRLKRNVQAIPDVLQKLEQLNGYTYFYKDTLGYDAKNEQIGVIAQELQKVLPQLVDTLRKGEDLLGVNYAQLTAFLIEVNKAQQSELLMIHDELADQSALYQSEAKQQQQHIADIKAENARLKADNEAMQATLQSILNRMDKIEAHAGQVQQSVLAP